jgi:hypothetical protein
MFAVYSYSNLKRRIDGLPNGLELSCPAEASTLPRIVRHAVGPGKLQPGLSPPGQFQREPV